MIRLISVNLLWNQAINQLNLSNYSLVIMYLFYLGFTEYYHLIWKIDASFKLYKLSNVCMKALNTVYNNIEKNKYE